MRPIDIGSLRVKTGLNSKIWDSNKKLKSKVRKNLIKIAEDFFEDLDIPWGKLEDILFTGSLASNNWSKYSDIDVHLLIDYSLVNKDENIVEKFFSARKNLWNSQHDIDFFGFDVEVYVQDTSEEHHASGLYSIKNDVWITEPNIKDPEIQESSIRKKATVIMHLIDDVYKLYKEKKYSLAISEAEKLTEKIKKFRSCGLDSGGEYSVENLTYKVLRRNKYLQKLWDIKINSYTDLMSI